MNITTQYNEVPNNEQSEIATMFIDITAIMSNPLEGKGFAQLDYNTDFTPEQKQIIDNFVSLIKSKTPITQ